MVDDDWLNPRNLWNCSEKHEGLFVMHPPDWKAVINCNKLEMIDGASGIVRLSRLILEMTSLMAFVWRRWHKEWLDTYSIILCVWVFGRGRTPTSSNTFLATIIPNDWNKWRVYYCLGNYLLGCTTLIKWSPFTTILDELTSSLQDVVGTSVGLCASSIQWLPFFVSLFKKDK